MARRDPRSRPAARPEREASGSRSPGAVTSVVEDEPDVGFARVAEVFRRATLGLTAVLFVARAYFPSEDADSGTGLGWVLAILGAAGLGVIAQALSGTFRVRWSWADAAVLALIVLVGLSATHAADRRPAITMAWEWGAMGLLYLIVRNLPRARGESAALAGVVVATAVAVSAYGLYQVPVEFARLREMYKLNKAAVLTRLEIEPGTPAAAALENRLLNSNDAFSTFALANSLAGFLVGPLALGFAVALENLKRGGRGSRLVALLLAAVPGLMLLTCLVMTKSRSGWIGLFVASLVLAWRSRRALPTRVLAASALGMAVLVGGLVVGGLATRQLDVQVLTQSTLSLRYRWEYWVGTWAVITDSPSPFAAAANNVFGGPGGGAPDPGRSGTFWSGVGPANFAMPYLGHKLPQASEEIRDPHNLILEVWATAGAFAALALLLAIGIGLREILGPARVEVDDSGPPDIDPKRGDRSSGATWIVATSGLGWLAVWALGKLNPMSQPDLFARWLLLGLGWSIAVVFGSALWRRRPIPAAGAGAGVLALAINLLASGGIGIPSVAMSLWVLLALGMNLREDRRCGRLRDAGGLGGAIVAALVWSALAGTFVGAVWPFWKSEAERATGDALMAMKPPAFEAARREYTRAIESDHYNAKPWVALAELEFRYWQTPEGQRLKEKQWEKVILALDGALDPKWRDPNNLRTRRLQASYARMILRELRDAKPLEEIHLRTKVVQAFRRATFIYPTNAGLHDELARASAEIGMFADAAREGRLALQLDGLTPHEDKKLPEALRSSLKAVIPKWDEKAKEPPLENPALKKGAK